jgi:hypothetical protein
MRRGGTGEPSGAPSYTQLDHGCANAQNSDAMLGIGCQPGNLAAIRKLAPTLEAGGLAFVVRDVEQSEHSGRGVEANVADALKGEHAGYGDENYPHGDVVT